MNSNPAETWLRHLGAGTTIAALAETPTSRVRPALSRAPDRRGPRHRAALHPLFRGPAVHEVEVAAEVGLARRRCEAGNLRSRADRAQRKGGACQSGKP